MDQTEVDEADLTGWRSLADDGPNVTAMADPEGGEWTKAAELWESADGRTMLVRTR